MINQLYTGTPTSRRFVILPAAQASVLLAGTPILIGKLPCVLLDNYQSDTGGSTAFFGGTFSLTVIGASDEMSPPTGHQINPGDKIYASGTLDSPTNVTYGLTLDANSSNTFFGNLDPQQASIAAGTTNTAAGVFLPLGA